MDEKGDTVNMNRLTGEKSLYLRQHASNPVDWYPWSAEALERAKREDRPVIVSIGYSACHWCHVMERESFEDPETARIMNENFVCIKVDREERPDIDSLYMKAVQALTGQGGWPLTVFTTPEGEPFFGGTYFPPHDRNGLPSFKKVLMAVVDIYRDRRERVTDTAKELKQALKKYAAPAGGEAVGPDLLERAFESGRIFFDPLYGGFGSRQKFPYPMFLSFLLLYMKRTGSEDASFIITKTLDAMAKGAMYDHLGGGFHRYTVDRAYRVPHFEKMLYDNAQLTSLYALAFREFKRPLYRKVVEETVEYLLREMRSDEGGYFASQDADTEEGEGAYYLWSADEVKKILGQGAGDFTRYFPITEEGDYEGRNTLWMDPDADAPVPGSVEEMKKRLFEARMSRKGPQRDSKIITGWNGLVISAFVQAAYALDREELVEEAALCARFILEHLRDPGGRLLRHYAQGASNVRARLEDHALLGIGLVTLYEATGESLWLDKARELAAAVKTLFYDENKRLFFDAGSDEEPAFIRERNLFDNDLPCGNSAAADLFHRLFLLTGEEELLGLARQVFGSVDGLGEGALSHGNFLYTLERDLESESPVLFAGS